MTAIQFQEISKHFCPEKPILNNICFSVKEGDFLGLLGLNGAGKTTLIRILTGLIPPSSGIISLFDVANIFLDPIRAKQFLGIVPQEVNFSPFKTLEEVLIFYGYLNRLSYQESLRRIDYLLEALDLSNKRHSRLGSLSGGMKRRAMLARALIHQPKILILDEPTAGVDIEMRERIWALLKDLHRKGTTLLLTSHYLEEMELLCNHIILLHQGTIVLDKPISFMRQQLSAQERWEVTLRQNQSIAVDQDLELLDGKWTASNQYAFCADKQTTVTDLVAMFSQKGYEVLKANKCEPRLEQFLKEYSK